MRLTRREAVLGVGFVLVAALVLGSFLWIRRPQVAAAPSAMSSPTLAATLVPTREPTPTATPTPVPTPTPIAIDETMLHSRLTVLLVGIDRNRWRSSRVPNSDSMVVASVDGVQRTVATLALPRDTVDVPLGDGRTWNGKANAIRSALGVGALRNAFETLLGIDIDYYIEIDMDDFQLLVHAVGGIDVEVPYALNDPGLGLYLKPGVQHLNGPQALYYSRSRVQDGDYARAGRQQQVFVALARKLVAPDTEIDYAALLGRLGSVDTDIPLDKIPTLAAIARRASDAEVSSQVLGPPRFALFEGLAGSRGWIMLPNIAEMRAYAQAVIGAD